jgi:hypothetical protein
MRQIEFNDAEIALLREALAELRRQFSHERRREDIQVLTAIDNLLERVSPDPESKLTLPE